MLFRSIHDCVSGSLTKNASPYLNIFLTTLKILTWNLFCFVHCCRYFLIIFISLYNFIKIDKIILHIGYVIHHLAMSKLDIRYYRNKYIHYIHQFHKKHVKDEEHRIYEYLWAVRMGMIMWNDIPPGFEDMYDIPHRRDYGIDLISLDYARSAQVKLYQTKHSRITWEDMAKYLTYSDKILCCSE